LSRPKPTRVEVPIKKEEEEEEIYWPMYLEIYLKTPISTLVNVCMYISGSKRFSTLSDT